MSELSSADHSTTHSRPEMRIPAMVMIAFVWIGLLLIVVIFADLLTPHDVMRSDLRARLQPPLLFGGTWAHPLGTDELGRDMFSRLLISIRVSMLVAFAGTVIGAVLGTLLGMLAAARGGFVDDVIMMLVDVQAALPFIILALAVIAFLGGGLTLFVIVVGLYGWERYARIARGLTLAAREDGYAVATANLGAGNVRIYLVHILPNIISALVVAFTVNFPETMLLETSLSFLGLGIQPPSTSLGTMLGDGRDYLTTAWWIAVAPGIVIALTGIAVSVIGDWLRDLFDPSAAGAVGGR